MHKMNGSDPKAPVPRWLAGWMEAQRVALWGVADLRDFLTPRDGEGRSFPFALSWVVPMNPEIMAGITGGPTQAYADEYVRVNRSIDGLSAGLERELTAGGFRSRSIPASERTDPIAIRGAFPHKTAATRAGLGWIGTHSQLITRPFGPWVRLGTVFTNLDLPCGPPLERSFCGRCRRCVDACPAKALTGTPWHPGLPRERMIDVRACDRWKKEHYFRYNGGHNCGICAAVCPYGSEAPKRGEDSRGHRR